MDTSEPALELHESARTTTRTSTRKARVEIITRGEPRRSWTETQKREIVAESLGPELTPTEVARKHAISSGQLYTWRQQLLGVQTAPPLCTEAAPACQSARKRDPRLAMLVQQNLEENRNPPASTAEGRGDQAAA
jgi:transposase-like protein